MVDGVAIGPEHEQIAIEVKSPRDDIVRGIGQCFEALAAGYTRCTRDDATCREKVEKACLSA